VRKEDIILHKWSPCHEPTDADEERRWRYKRSDDELFTGSSSKLWPFSEITAGVVVLNGAKEGDISNTVTFDTPQGGKIIVVAVLLIFKTYTSYDRDNVIR